MAAIYQADIWCDDCAYAIKGRIWAESEDHPAPSNIEAWEKGVGYDDERNYDSAEYPKHCDDDEESDCPQHCAAGPDCLNAYRYDGENLSGYFFGNSLTPEGEDYVVDAVKEDVASGCVDSVACTVWMPYYDWIDYGDIYLCDSCNRVAVCDDDGFCVDCAD